MRYLFLPLLPWFAACAASPPAPSAETTKTETGPVERILFITSGEKKGEQIESVGADGSKVVRFYFTDRGRGPDVTMKTWSGDDEIPDRIEIRGVDYYKVEVREDFVREGDTARWDNRSEHGSAPVRGPAFYIALDSTPEEGAQLVRAAWKLPGHRLPVLPSGEVEVAALGTREVTRDGASEKKTVTLYWLSGIDFTPGFIWLDENQRMFAALGGFSWLIREGWEGSVKELEEYQRQKSRESLEEAAKRLAKRSEKPVVFQNVALFDSEAGKVLRDQTVIVSGEKISAVGASAKLKVPAGAEVIDGRGHMLLPGLWDMHVHFGDSDGLFHLAGGVTSVRDLGNDVEKMLKAKAAFDAGTLIGPRVTWAGFIDGPGPFALPIGKVVSNEQEMRTAIDAFADQGAEQIKLYSSLDPKLVPVAVEHAKKRGMRVSGHVPNGMHASEFVEQGADELQHANFLVLNFIDGPDTRTPERFHAVGREGAALELASPKVKAFIELLKTKKTVLDPTLVTFETMFTQKPGEVSRTIEPVDARLPINARRGFRRGGVAPAGMEEKYKAAYTRMMEIVAEAHRQGVQLVVGTDDIGGFSLHRELELYVKAGIPASDALKLCTFGAARVMKRADTLGAITVGRLADLYLVEGDPTQRIEDIRRGVWVMKGGVMYRTQNLYEAIGVRSEQR